MGALEDLTVPVSVRRADGSRSDAVAIEAPVEIRVEGEALAVLMRSPGADEALAAGFLLTEGVIEDHTDLMAIGRVADNVIDVRLASGVAPDLERFKRQTYAGSSCGICGKTSIERVRVQVRRPLHRVTTDPAWVTTLPDLLRADQPGFAATGGLHAAALAHPDTGLGEVFEDIGRHNAVDKVLGACLLANNPVLPVLVVSSRASFEIVQKARVAGVGTVVVVGAATSLAIDLAAEVGIELYGFVGSRRWTRYADEPPHPWER